MTRIPKMLHAFAVFMDGSNYMGIAEQVQLPNLTIVTEDTRAGGLDAAIKQDMGMEPLDSVIDWLEWEPAILKRFGLTTDTTRLTIRGSQEGRTSNDTIIVEMTGRVLEQDLGSLQAGQRSKPKTSFNAEYLKITINGEDVVEIDVLNMIRKIGGVDQLEARRTALNV